MIYIFAVTLVDNTFTLQHSSGLVSLRPFLFDLGFAIVVFIFGCVISHIASVCLNFVFIDSMIAAPVIHVDHWVTIHRWCVTAATSNDLVIWRNNYARCKLRDKPDAGRTTHPRESVLPRVWPRHGLLFWCVLVSCVFNHVFSCSRGVGYSLRLARSVHFGLLRLLVPACADTPASAFPQLIRSSWYCSYRHSSRWCK